MTAASGTSLGEPIEIEFPTGGKKKFKTFEQVLAWADGQHKEWQPLFKASSGKPEPYTTMPAAVQNALNSIREQASAGVAQPEQQKANHRTKINQHLKRFREGRCQPAEAPVVQWALERVTERPLLALGGLAAQIPSELVPPQQWTPVIQGAIETSLLGTNAEDAAHAQAKALEQVWTDWEHRLNEQVERLDAAAADYDEKAKAVSELHNTQEKEFTRITTEAQTKLNKVVADHEEKVEHLRDAFRSEMRLRAPAEYWSTKAKTHDEKANFWLWWFTGLAVIGLLGAGFFGWWLLGEVTRLRAEKLVGVGFEFVAIITVPALIYFWGLRHVSRLLVQNRRLADDAEERHTMVATFLALSADTATGVADDERLLVLQALFRPGPGDTQEESVPSPMVEMLHRAREGIR